MQPDLAIKIERLSRTNSHVNRDEVGGRSIEFPGKGKDHVERIVITRHLEVWRCNDTSVTLEFQSSLLTERVEAESSFADRSAACDV
ncbi:MAG: hypothetical protein ACRDJJ_04860 [Actinomycetota bacterium]